MVFGGRSGEHAISCVTAGSVLEAIDRAAYDVVPIGIAADGRWVLESGDPELMRLNGPGGMPHVDADRAGVTLARAEAGTELVVTEPGAPPDVLGQVDVVFPVLHGPWGEDGTIQGMLEMTGVRYVGAGVLASALAMDKSFMKMALSAVGLPVMPSVTVTAKRWQTRPGEVREQADALGYPLFVKPARGGSSLGISKAHHAGELDDTLATAMRQDPKVLLEVAAEGAREVECGVLERLEGGSETSLPAEIRITGQHEFYDFEAKYVPAEATELDVPAVLPEEVATRIRELSARAFDAIGCEGLARVDFFVFSDGSVVVNEINTMPGFTPLSMFPQMWAAVGLDYPALVDRLLELALARDTGLR